MLTVTRNPYRDARICRVCGNFDCTCPARAPPRARARDSTATESEPEPERSVSVANSAQSSDDEARGRHRGAGWRDDGYSSGGYSEPSGSRGRGWSNEHWDRFRSSNWEKGSSSSKGKDKSKNHSLSNAFKTNDPRVLRTPPCFLQGGRRLLDSERITGKKNQLLVTFRG